MCFLCQYNLMLPRMIFVCKHFAVYMYCKCQSTCCNGKPDFFVYQESFSNTVCISTGIIDKSGLCLVYVTEKDFPLVNDLWLCIVLQPAETFTPRSCTGQEGISS